MSTTKILGEAVGIQRQDIIDQTEEQLADSLSSATILGRFRRGRFDKPMMIHQGNIRGQLGYDPKNPDYIAVQDCLDTGVPSMQVLRIKGDCPCISNFMQLPTYSQPMNYGVTRYEITVNGTKYNDEDTINEININRGIEVLFNSHSALSDVLRLGLYSGSPTTLQNLTNTCLTLSMTAQFRDYHTEAFDPEVTLIPTTSLCAFVGESE